MIYHLKNAWEMPRICLIFWTIVLETISYSALAAENGIIQGDVYLVTRSGEVRQGAANQIFLIPRDIDLSEEWRNVCSSQKADFDAIQANNNQRSAELDRLVDTASSSSVAQRYREDYIEHLEYSLSSLQDAVRTQSRERTEWIISKAQSQAPTGMRAHYEFSLAPGLYWLFAEMQLGSNFNRWLVPIEIESGDALTLDLDNNNLLAPTKFNCDNQPFEQE